MNIDQTPPPVSNKAEIELLESMKVNDSILLHKGDMGRSEYLRIYSRWYERADRRGIKLVFRKSPEGLRVWRTK